MSGLLSVFTGGLAYWFRDHSTTITAWILSRLVPNVRPVPIRITHNDNAFCRNFFLFTLIGGKYSKIKFFHGFYTSNMIITSILEDPFGREYGD